MKIYTLFMIVLVVIGVLALVAFVVPKHLRKRVAIILSTACFIFVGIFFTYLFNPRFKCFVNININQDLYHICFFDKENYTIPLPPNTAMNFRTSGTQAVYITKSTVDEISEHYNQLAKTGTFSEIDENNLRELIFEYQENKFSITIEEENKTRNFIIGVIE